MQGSRVRDRLRHGPRAPRLAAARRAPRRGARARDRHRTAVRARVVTNRSPFAAGPLAAREHRKRRSPFARAACGVKLMGSRATLVRRDVPIRARARLSRRKARAVCVGRALAPRPPTACRMPSDVRFGTHASAGSGVGTSIAARSRAHLRHAFSRRRARRLLRDAAKRCAIVRPVDACGIDHQVRGLHEVADRLALAGRQ